MTDTAQPEQRRIWTQLETDLSSAGNAVGWLGKTAAIGVVVASPYAEPGVPATGCLPGGLESLAVDMAQRLLRLGQCEAPAIRSAGLGAIVGNGADPELAVAWRQPASQGLCQLWHGSRPGSSVDSSTGGNLPLQRSAGGPGVVLNLELTALSADGADSHSGTVAVAIAGHPRMDETVLFLAIGIGAGADPQR